MKVSHGKGPASHPDSESCVDGRKAGGEALTGAHAGQPSSCEIRSFGVPTLLSEAEGNTGSGVTGEPLSDPAQSETLHTRGNSSHGNREVPTPPEGNTGRPEKATSRTSGNLRIQIDAPSDCASPSRRGSGTSCNRRPVQNASRTVCRQCQADPWDWHRVFGRTRFFGRATESGVTGNGVGATMGPA